MFTNRLRSSVCLPACPVLSGCCMPSSPPAQLPYQQLPCCSVPPWVPGFLVAKPLFSACRWPRPGETPHPLWPPTISPPVNCKGRPCWNAAGKTGKLYGATVCGRNWPVWQRRQEWLLSRWRCKWGHRLRVRWQGTKQEAWLEGRHRRTRRWISGTNVEGCSGVELATWGSLERENCMNWL